MSESSKAEEIYAGDRVWVMNEDNSRQKPATVIVTYLLSRERKAVVQRDGESWECIYPKRKLRKIVDDTWQHELAKRIVDGEASLPHLAQKIIFHHDTAVYAYTRSEKYNTRLWSDLFGFTYVDSAEKGKRHDLAPVWHLVEETRNGQ